MDGDGIEARHPRRGTKLIGQERAEAELLAAFNAGRLPHGWLIGGPSGIGKATLAYRFARFLLAREGGRAASPALFGDDFESLDVAPEHPAARQMAAGAHPDLIAVERQVSERTKALSSVIRVDQIHDVVRFFRLTPGSGGWRVAIVDGADLMNPQAANAILKILEEPPTRAVLLLVAHAPNRVLPTIRSRCRKLSLHPLEIGEVADFLGGELPEMPVEDRLALARLAEGRPGRALALADEGGLDAYRQLVELMQTLPRLDHSRAHAVGDRLGRRDQAASHAVWMDLLALWLNRLVLAGAGRAPAAAVAGEDELQRRLLARGGLDRWLELWEKISRLARQSDGLNLDRKHVVLNAFLAVEAVARG
jgi:DNA polymerase III subunit delta'